MRITSDLKALQVALPIWIRSYVANKAEVTRFEKLADGDNKSIKEAMKELELTEIEVDDIRATRSISERFSMDEAKLLVFLKDKKIRGAIKTRQYVDMDIVEKAIYDGKLVAKDIAPFQTKSEVVSLRIGKVRKDEAK